MIARGWLVVDRGQELRDAGRPEENHVGLLWLRRALRHEHHGH